MDLRFALDHSRLAAQPDTAALAAKLGRYSCIDSAESFNCYCREACLAWEPPRGRTSRLYQELLGRIEQGGPDTIPTSWGGVAVTLHDPPRVEKFLVIRRGGYLALEKHELKDEQIEVREGAGLLLSRRSTREPLQAEALAPGGRFHFEPGMEHCIIGTEDLLVFERSIDPKGMDKDLIFLYEPT